MSHSTSDSNGSSSQRRKSTMERLESGEVDAAATAAAAQRMRSQFLQHPDVQHQQQQQTCDQLQQQQSYSLEPQRATVPHHNQSRPGRSQRPPGHARRSSKDSKHNRASCLGRMLSRVQYCSHIAMEWIELYQMALLASLTSSACILFTILLHMQRQDNDLASLGFAALSRNNAAAATTTTTTTTSAGIDMPSSDEYALYRETQLDDELVFDWQHSAAMNATRDLVDALPTWSSIASLASDEMNSLLALMKTEQQALAQDPDNNATPVAEISNDADQATSTTEDDVVIKKQQQQHDVSSGDQTKKSVPATDAAAASSSDKKAQRVAPKAAAAAAAAAAGSAKAAKAKTPTHAKAAASPDDEVVVSTTIKVQQIDAKLGKESQQRPHRAANKEIVDEEATKAEIRAIEAQLKASRAGGK